jgi:hypothetical protein
MTKYEVETKLGPDLTWGTLYQEEYLERAIRERDWKQVEYWGERLEAVIG